MNLLLLVAIGGLLLLAFFIAIRLRALALSIRLVCALLAQPCLLLAFVWLQVATACKQGCITCLAGAEESQTETSASYLVGAAIARIIYLVTASILVVAGFPLDILRTAAFYGLAAVHLDLQLDALTALTWVLLPGAWGCLFVEALGIVPAWARLLPLIHTRKVLPWGVGIIAMVMFLASLLVTFAFHASSQCQLLAPACTTDVSLQVFIAGAFNTLLIAAAGTLGLFGMMIGLTGFAGSVLALLYCVFSLLHGVCGFLGSCIASVAQSHPTSDIQVSFFPSIGAAGTTPLLPAPLVQNTQHPINQEDLLMQDTRRTTTVIGFGDFGYRFVPLLVEIAQVSGIASTLLAAGMVDVERIYRTDTPLAVSGMKDISPSLATITRTLAQESGNAAYTQLASGMIEKIVNAYTAKHGGTLIVSTPLQIIPALVQCLHALKLRLPRQHLMIVTMLPPQDQRDEQFEDAYADLHSLSDTEGIQIVECDPNSSCAMQHGEEAQEHMLAATLLGVCVAPLHDERNPTCSEVGKRLRDYAPFTGIACTVAPVAHGKTPLIWRAVKAVAPKAGERGSGDAHDLFIQAKACTRQVLEDVADTIPEKLLAVDAPVFLVYTIPLPLADKRFHAFVAAIHAYVKHTSHHARAIVVRGNAPAAPTLPQGYRIGVSAWYPLSLVSLPQAEEDNTTSVMKDLQEETTPVEALNGTAARRGRKPKVS